MSREHHLSYTGRVPSSEDAPLEVGKKNVQFDLAQGEKHVDKARVEKPADVAKGRADVADEPSWMVDEIVGHRYVPVPGRRRGAKVKEYRVKWIGYGEPTWQTRAQLQNNLLVDGYERRSREIRMEEKRVKAAGRDRKAEKPARGDEDVRRSPRLRSGRG